MVKKNFPIPSNWIVTDMDVRDPDFFKKVTRADELVYYDDNGVRSILETSSVWGYSYKGDLYINLGGAFHKIDFFGRISFFKAAKTTYYSNPLMGAYHTLDFWSTAPILVTARNAEYLVDIDENKVWEFTVPGLEYVLKNDSVLWNEFASLREREKEDMKYIFLNRYNKKYPLTIPFD
jgi:hypothetical protein